MTSIEKAVKKLISGGNDGAELKVGKSSQRHYDSYNTAISTDDSQVVCHIDTLKLKNNGYLTPDSTDEVQAEQYRILKRPLLTNAFNEGPDKVPLGNSIMVTSAIEGEGKTYSSFNLAISMAMERNTTVLLIDSDVIKASLSRLLGLEGNLGLIDLLVNPELNLSDLIVPTDIPRLKILPAGRPNVHSTELLASEHMKALAKELSSQYADRVILFDAPPLLATSQAKIVTNLVGQILLVVEVGNTPQELVVECASQLDKNKIVGVLLNKSRRISHGYYGGYYGPSR